MGLYDKVVGEVENRTIYGDADLGENAAIQQRCWVARESTKAMGSKEEEVDIKGRYDLLGNVPAPRAFTSL